MHSHKYFILSPINNILEDVVSASAGIGSGIETYPLCDYIMQSVFLKMTGFQEQKMKCICWELATLDYEYRYERFTKKTLGECSSYEEKKTVYKDLVEQIRKRNSDYKVFNKIDKERLLKDTRLEIKNIFFNTNLSVWAQNSFNEFIKRVDLIEPEHFIAKVKRESDETKLFENVLQDKYEILYKHRNRCAHNTLSYQQNLPTLKTLMHENYQFENYFIYFAILILTDKIFIELYTEYLKTLEEN